MTNHHEDTEFLPWLFLQLTSCLRGVMSLIHAYELAFALASLLSKLDFIFFNYPDFTFAFDDIGINNALLNIITGRNIKHGFS